MVCRTPRVAGAPKAWSSPKNSTSAPVCTPLEDRNSFYVDACFIFNFEKGT